MVKTNPEFLEFISPSCNRLQFIRDFFTKRNIETSVYQIQNKNHIFVCFSSNQYDPLFKIKTLIAHYDRVGDSQGANDNSFAVFMLMTWALKLSSLPFAHNIRLIFTDGEESTEGIQNQGAYGLAHYLKKAEADKGDVFVFDCMGRGDIPILCQTNLASSIKAPFAKKITSLENTAATILSQSSNKWISLPTAYSDNAGFLLAGIPAVTISMLPSKEAENYMKLLMKTKSISFFDVLKPENKEEIKSFFPPTWLLINSHRDTIETLTEESEIVFSKILENITIKKTLA